MADSTVRLWSAIAILVLMNLDIVIATNVTVTKGGYTNIVVAIGDKVPEDVNLIKRIKDDFTAASSFLFSATNRRLYFSEITILVPSSWTTYTPTDTIQSERFETSDIIIDVSQEDRPERPFTNKYTGCGQPGQYIHFTPTFITSDAEANKYGGYGKTIAHEWAHYRWGVFDEYRRPGASYFYAASNGYYEATRCTLAVPGNAESIHSGRDGECNPRAGEPPEHCRFVDDRIGGTYGTSLLYKQFLPKITGFCDKHENPALRHNREAPNLQNIHCFGKSTWQVMKEHVDIQSSTQLSSRTDTTPTFREVKPSSNYWVLVLDTSGSMRGERLRQLRQAASNFISTAVQLNEYLSIVTFNGSYTLNSPLTEIKDQNTRDNLIATLPVSAGGTSNIGQGIQLGRAQLANKKIYGGRMLVITDAEETKSPFIRDIVHLLKEYLISVDTIAIGPDSTPNLEFLTRETDGQSFYYSDSSTALDEAFKAFSERNRGASEALITLFSKFEKLQPMQSITYTVTIDSSIGEDTQFIFDYNQGAASVEGVLIRPDGTMITKADMEYVEDADFGSTRITIGGTAEAGEWMLTLTNMAFMENDVTIIVQSRARNQVDPIRATATWGKESVGIMSNTVETNNQTLFVTVSKGYVPILNAEVTASVSAPNGEIIPFLVTDDGLGADIQQNDGIYSAFLTEFKGEGRYGLSVMVENKQNMAILSPATVLGQGSIIDPDDEMMWQDISADKFQRVVNGGSFTCTGIVCSGTSDVFPPARILDLEAEVRDLSKPEVTLTFTAPGDNLMTGIVQTIEIRSSLGDINVLFDDFENAELVTSFTNNQIAGSDSFTVVSNLDIGPHSYFFAIVAIDDSNHRSLVSNIASASMRFVTLPPGVTFPPEPPSTTSVVIIPTTEIYESTTIVQATGAVVSGFTPVAIAIAVAAPLIVILLALALIACCLLCCKKRKRSDKKNQSALENGNAMPIYGNLESERHRQPLPEPTYDNTDIAETEISVPTETMLSPAEPMVSAPDITGQNRMSAALMASAAMSAVENARSAALMASAPETQVIYDTRQAVLVSQGESGASQEEDSNPLESKVEAQPNNYSELPEKRNGYANGSMPGGSGPSSSRRDSSSDEEDEIARQKRIIRELASQDEEFKYY